MNPALLQQTSYQSLDYTLNSDNKYLGHDRTFTQPASYTSNDFPFLSRKPHNGLSSGTLNQTLSVPTNTGLEYNPQPPLPDHSYDTGSHLLLSPPSSIDGSHTSSLQPVSASFNFSGIPKLAASNASSTDHYSPLVGQYPQASWSDTAMTEIRHSRPPVLQPQVPPQLSYGQPNGISTQYLGSSNRAMEQFSGSYPIPRPFNGPDMHHGLFRQHPRSPTFTPLPMPMSMSMSMAAPYAANASYASMQAHAQARPDGPPFEDTRIIHSLVTARNHTLNPDITANIQKGFFQVDGKWTCYRRNYFTVSCAFSFKNAMPEGSVYLQRHSSLELVQQYAISISAKTGNGTNQESESRQLVQHTPKRDKATESVPGRHLVQPAAPQSLQSHGNLTGASMYGGGQHIPPNMMGGYAGFTPQGHLSAPTSHTFERIQFQKATANNGKRRAQQQYFHVVVELSVNVGRSSTEENWVLIATRQSHPMVVRGRSPGHYKDNVRRDGQTHRDSDHGSGTGGEGGSINLPMPSFVGGSQTSAMDWAPSHRQNHHYGGSYYRNMYESDCSPHSESSSTTLTDSPTESVFQLGEIGSSKTGTVYDFERPTLMPIADGAKDVATDHSYSAHSSRKRRLHDDEASSEHEFYSSSMYTEGSISPRSFDFVNTSGVKSLCASS